MKADIARWVLAAALLIGAAGHAGGEANEVLIMRVADAIGPGTADFIHHGIKTAEKQQAACLIIELDTPGGLAESMRRIVQDILASPVPVAVYVSPGGGRAASAGVMITMAADIAAMAPGTNIGAAHPVGAGMTWWPRPAASPSAGAATPSGWKRPSGRACRPPKPRR